jgi:hypothetical protein
VNWKTYNSPSEAADMLSPYSQVTIASTTHELMDLACGNPNSASFEVASGKGRHFEASSSGRIARLSGFLSEM